MLLPPHPLVLVELGVCIVLVSLLNSFDIENDEVEEVEEDEGVGSWWLTLLLLCGVVVLELDDAVVLIESGEVNLDSLKIKSIFI